MPPNVGSGLFLAVALSAGSAIAAADAAPASPGNVYLGVAFIVALLFAAIHLCGRAMAFLRTSPRSIWLSAAGGISVAYVFVHILPELEHHQHEFDVRGGPLGLLDASERHVYFVALVGLAAFYGLDSLARRHGPQAATASSRRERVFWLHLAAYAAFNVLIGYLLLDRDEPGLFALLTYAVAMAMHFVVADQGLREQFHPAYDRQGRWLLAAAPLVGWALGAWVDVAPLAVSALFAFLAGGIVLNVLKEELPERRHAHFSAFALGAGIYAAVLLAAD
ncbi:MAG: hypothetical protein U1E52_19650 [Geminicoccaceae bacterium]